MNEHEVMKKAFSELHASDDTLQKVLQKTHAPKRIAPRRIAILVAAVVAICSLALVVQGTVFVLLGNHLAILNPAENPGTFLDDVYGGNISTEKPEMFDSQGNPITLPDMERPAVNPEEAKEWIGEYINDVSGVFTVGDNTFTLKSFMIDENGTGVFTWSAENPNGIPYGDAGYGAVYFSPVAPFGEPMLYHYSADGEQKLSTCTFNELISKNEAGTKLELVTYFGTFEKYEIGDHFVWEVSYDNIQITPTVHIPAKTMTAADGMRLWITHHGIAVDFDSDTCISEEKIVVYFQDGTQYCVYDWRNQIYNSPGGLWRKSEEYNFDDLVIPFNRLIDVNEISHVEILYEDFEDVLINGKTEVLSHRHNCVFYP
jgi:hypothetical protein